MDRKERERLNKFEAEPVNWVPKDESEHFFKCKECGQWVDMRKWGDVRWHDEPGHDPIPEYPMDTKPVDSMKEDVPAFMAWNDFTAKKQGR